MLVGAFITMEEERGANNIAELRALVFLKQHIGISVPFLDADFIQLVEEHVTDSPLRQTIINVLKEDNIAEPLKSRLLRILPDGTLCKTNTTTDLVYCLTPTKIKLKDGSVEMDGTGRVVLEDGSVFDFLSGILLLVSILGQLLKNVIATTTATTTSREEGKAEECELLLRQHTAAKTEYEEVSRRLFFLEAKVVGMWHDSNGGSEQELDELVNMYNEKKDLGNVKAEKFQRYEAAHHALVVLRKELFNAIEPTMKKLQLIDPMLESDQLAFPKNDQEN